MSSPIPKLSAMAGAACLLATMALPAHAAPLPDAAAAAVAAPAASGAAVAAPAAASPAAQTLTVDATAGPAADVKGAALVSTLIPVPVAPAPVAPVVEVAAEAEAAAPAEAGGTPTAAAPEAPSIPAQSGSAVLDYAAQFVGVVPYGMGNTPDTSFSCDGFVQYVFSSFGYSLPRGADHQAAMGTPISRAEAVAGDLVWWPGQHIGIYDGAGGMYDSPNWGRFVQHPAQLWGAPTFIRLG